jgi:hypothetical protein
MAMMTDAMKLTRNEWLRRAAAAALALALCGSATRALGVALTLDAAKTDARSVKLCVGLDSAGQKVAGTQNDLIWDAGCANLKPNSCAAVPDSKKPLHGNTPPNLPNTYRALVFALDNVDPIRDGPLYCCEFELTSSDPCCAVRFDRLGASDPVGNAQTTVGKPDRLCLATGAAAAGEAPAAPPAAAPPSESSNWIWLALIGAAVVVVAILVLRGRNT